MNCSLCPHNCTIPEGGYGICGTRTNRDGKIIDEGYGILSALNMDPIEKKPLYHYYPGKSVLSAGFFGCNLKCPFCQNHSISQNFQKNSRRVSPGELVQSALDSGSFGIAYTYSEPLIHHEYLIDASKAARRKGLKNILITNGMINSAAGAELLQFIDAANIDLKSYNPDFYRNELKGELESVLNFIRAASKKIHIEVTTLVIPGKNDSEQEIEAIAEFIADMDPMIPLHLSAYFPQYKYTVPPTASGLLLNLVEKAKEHLSFVYPGNIATGSQDTFCSDCGNLLIKRTGYSTRVTGIENGNCRSCGHPSPIIL